MGDMEQAGCVQRLMILETEARQMYYQAMNVILHGTGFRFERRSKRPPLDALNSMISFGNTLLYNAVLKAIWKTALDPRIGIVHATTERDYSLNLDFADLTQQNTNEKRMSINLTCVFYDHFLQLV